MPISRVYLENFRLFKKKDLNLSKKKIFIQGDNGSGKTSILESIELLMNGRSFRTSKSKDCINHESDNFQISLKGSYNEQEIIFKSTNKHSGRIGFSRKLNDKTITKGSVFFLQTLLAKNFRMIEGEPDLRREHINNLMFHVKPDSYKAYMAYNRALRQRNRCLKQKISTSEISSWTKNLANIGVSLSKQQYDFFNNFKKEVMGGLALIAKNEEVNFLNNADLRFDKGWVRSEALLTSLQNSIEKDYALGYTSLGPHRMDCKYYIKGKRAASVLSRGQSKLLIILIFLINHSLINSYIDSEAVLLIDDLGSELDLENLEFVLQQISKAPNQVILTGIQGEDLEKIVSKYTNFKRINL